MSDKQFFVCTRGTATDPEDQGVPGVSVVEVDMSEAPSSGDIAGAVLDEYHDSVAIALLDDFEIDVLDENGTLYVQSEDYEERSMQHIASFLSMIDTDDAPPAVIAYME